MSYKKPAHWADPTKKLFTHQVGFTCPPHDFDGAPSDFLRMSPDTVGVHGRMLHVPDYKHELSQRKQNFDLLEEFVQCMANNGVDVCGQVGSNWVHASGWGVEGIREYCERLSNTYETPFSHGRLRHDRGPARHERGKGRPERGLPLARMVAGHCRVFYMKLGFDVVWAGNFVDQGWYATQADVNEQIWVFDGELARKSFEYVAEQAPNVDAYLANGMCNFRRAKDGLPQRFVSLEIELEQMMGKPLITHDNALYWRIYKTLGIGPITVQGTLLSSLLNA